MKWYIINIIIGIASLFPTYAHADNTTVRPDSLKDKHPVYVDRLLRYRSTWNRLIPNQFTTQFAGSIGVVSFGAGWHYGKKDNWETDLLLGVVPRFNSPNCNPTFTLKERYIPWQFDTGTSWKLARSPPASFSVPFSEKTSGNPNPRAIPNATTDFPHRYAPTSLSGNVPPSASLPNTASSAAASRSITN